jgi:hypothetical protein
MLVADIGRVIVVMVVRFKLSYIGNMNKMDKIGLVHFEKVMDTNGYVIYLCNMVMVSMHDLINGVNGGLVGMYC